MRYFHHFQESGCGFVVVDDSGPDGGGLVELGSVLLGEGHIDIDMDCLSTSSSSSSSISSSVSCFVLGACSL